MRVLALMDDDHKCKTYWKVVHGDLSKNSFSINDEEAAKEGNISNASTVSHRYQQPSARATTQEMIAQ